jgi:DNA-binding MarR family transcriptional regulator
MIDNVKYFSGKLCTVMKNYSKVPQEFYFALLEFLMSAKQHLVGIGGSFGLTGMQTMTLLVTSIDQPRPISTYCRIYNCDPSNVTGIVDGLEQKNLVAREADPRDRRIKVIRLLPAGKKMQGEIIQALANAGGFMFDPLNDDEAQSFIKIIEKLAAHNRVLNCPPSK